MDISFTNVLEGARQYFQGLPAASSSTGSPAAPTPHRENDGSVHSEQHSAVPYWDHQNEGQGTHLTNKDVMNPHTNRNIPQNQTPSTNYPYEKGQQNYNYPPTSQVSHLYQSHIPAANNSYYELQTQQHNKNVPVNSNSTQPSSSTNSNHQTTSTTSSSSYNYQSQQHYPNYPSNSNAPMPSSQSPQEVHYNYKYQQQQPSRPSTYPANYYQHQTPTTAPIQQQQAQQPQHQQSQPQHQQPQHQQPQPQHQQPQPQHQQSQQPQQPQLQQQPQQIRTTHRLPVVPTEIYHSRQSARPVQRPATVINSSYQYNVNALANTTTAPNQNDRRVPPQNGGPPYSTEQYKYYQNSTKYSNSTYNNTITTTQANQYLNNNNNTNNNNNRSYGTVDSRVNTIQRPQPPTKVMQLAEPKQNSHKFPVNKQKRESPLDLSVKTVKTSADSTLGDTSYDERNNYRPMFNNRYENPHQQQQPQHQQHQPQHQQQYPSVRAPKVDFLPNFNMPTNQPSIIREDIRPNPTNKYYYNYTATTSNAAPPPVRESLPRIDFPALDKNIPAPPTEVIQQRKRSLEHLPPSSIPEKMPKVDIWRENIDKQIEQRLSSYTKSRLDQEYKPNIKMANGNTHHHPHTQLPQNKTNVNNDITNYKTHSSTSGLYNYPQYPNASSSTYYNFNQTYQNQTKPKPLQSINKQTANKKVLNLIRNRIEYKGAQKKLLEEQLQKQTYREMQQPSTDVMAPLQPKLGIVGRRNISPFTAVSLERNSNTPPSYKLHLPKAVDSVIFSDAEKEQQDHQASMGNQSNSTADLDGLAAFLAARIRTKAELKQVGGPSEPPSGNNNASAINPPKLKVEIPGNSLSHKKVASRYENGDPFAANKPLKIHTRTEIGGIRSSSETSVFDFPDSDAETEMPVLEKQGLVALRKDRKTVPAQFTGSNLDDNETQPLSPFDALFSQTCDTFMEQLKQGCRKKRGRRKKTTIEECIDEVVNPPLFQVKLEDEDDESEIFKDSLESDKIKFCSSNIDNVIKIDLNQKLIDQDYKKVDLDTEMNILVNNLVKANDTSHKTTNSDIKKDLDINDSGAKNVELDHKKVDIDHVKVNSDHKKVDLDHKTGDLDYKKVDLNYKKGVLEHKVDVGPKKVDIDHKNFGDHKKVDLDHKKVDLDHKKGDLDLKKVDLDHKKVKLGHKNIKLNISHRKVDLKIELERIDIEKTIKANKKVDSASDKTISSDIKLNENIKIKTEIDDLEYTKNEKLQVKLEKDKSDSDSDAPLIICKNKIKNKTKIEKKKIKVEKSDTTEKKIPKEISSDSDNESISETLRKNKKGLKISDLKDNTPPVAIGKTVKKPAFGDGSDFQPGWEEELYKYKKSIRMPRMLIQVTRPPNCQRLSTSLPDLDPCPMSPAPSSVTDIYDYKTKKFKTESMDSDLDSNCSFNFSFSKTNYDSEEGGSSVKSLNTKSNSILDKLMERYGGKKRKRAKKIILDDKQKTVQKSENVLLPTPSLELNKDKEIIKSESVLLGFRKKTVKKFKDAFINNSNKIMGINEFATVVLKSRTRTETRVLKEKATIREVFGEDRPASAPPITCLDELKSDDIKDEIKETKSKDKENFNKKPNELLGKILSRSLKHTIINKLKTEIDESKIKKEEDIKIEPIKKEEDIKIEPPIKKEDVKIEPIPIEVGETVKKRNKLRSIRRKFSSGFDYIRKKKKIVKKEVDAENVDASLKPKRRGLAPKANPVSIEDIQKEIKMWVLNKGVGETHLHRAARCGYTDITAYCLEKMACNPSPRDNAGYTPLHEACSRGHLEIAKLLLQYGANVSESAQGGIRPLHEASENGYVEIVRLLLAYGADPTLATYSGITPLQLAVDEKTVSVVRNHLSDICGDSKEMWTFNGPAECFDPSEMGYNTLDDVPASDSIPEEEDIEMEISEQLLPNLYAFPNSEDRWVLLQDLSTILKIKSKETLLRQLNVTIKSDIVKEMKTVDFLEQARCCQFLNANEKLNTRATKIFLVKYTEKVKQLLNIENLIIDAR